jgi:arginine decarboxylase
MYVPKKIFFTKGIGIHKEKLTSFEMALRNAGIAPFNLVSVSSIYPAGCVTVEREEGLKQLVPGQIVHAVIARSETNEPSRMINASIGVALPKDEHAYGYLSEHHSYGETAEHSGNYAEDLAAEMLSTILGDEFDPDSSWDDKRQVWQISGKIVESRNITAVAVGDEKGRWTTVLTAAIMLP